MNILKMKSSDSFFKTHIYFDDSLWWSLNVAESLIFQDNG